MVLSHFSHLSSAWSALSVLSQANFITTRSKLEQFPTSQLLFWFNDKMYYLFYNVILPDIN